MGTAVVNLSQSPIPRETPSVDSEPVGSAADVAGAEHRVMFMPDGDQQPSGIMTPELILLAEKALEAGVSQETFGQILSDALDDGAVGLAERLWEDAGRMLAEHD
jgi:hypothetical protein